MFFALKPDCFFREYEDIGYISRPIIGIEEVVDKYGSLFIKQLQYYPRNINDITRDLACCFDCVDNEELKKDILAFFTELSTDGFVNMNESLEEFENRGFDYSTLKGRMAYKHINSRVEQSSEIFLSKYCKEKPFLQNFHIELTSKCNERCIHCYIPHEMKDTDIAYDLMIDTLEQCKEIGVMTLVFSGGEPMLHPNFCEFLRYAKDLDFNVTVLSNLTILNDEIISALKYKHVCCVNVSLYSMEPKVHERITTIKGSFEKTKNNILRLIDNNIAVQINCPVMKQNKESFYKVIKWGEKHKCSVITDYVIMGRSDRSTDNLNNRLTKDDMEFVVKKIAENSMVFRSNLKNQGVFAENSSIYADSNERVCGVALSTMCMVSNGNVYPCAGWQQYVCGNIKNKSLKEIWENSPEIRYLRGLRLKDFKKCVNCDDYKYCLMCVSRNYNESPSGSMFDIPPISCDAAHIHRKVVEEIIANEGGFGNV